MSFAKYGIADQGVELGRSVLVLSALGLFAKLLHIDVSQLQVLGIKLEPTHAGLIPGFIGLALIYSLAAFCVSRMEAAIETQVDSAVIESRQKVTDSKPLLAISFLALPFTIAVYSMPYILGLFSVWLLWSDSVAVIRAIWNLAAS